MKESIMERNYVFENTLYTTQVYKREPSGLYYIGYIDRDTGKIIAAWPEHHVEIMKALQEVVDDQTH
jgi:hypothetical protein